MKILRIAIAVVGLLAIVVAGAAFYLLGREPIPEASSFQLDRPRLVALASQEGEGNLPVAVHHEVVAETSLPRAGVFAGEPFSPHMMTHGVYQILYPDGGYVLIDAAFGEEQLAEMSSDGKFDVVAFERVQRALREARKIVLTHEHSDHIGGLAQAGDLDGLAQRVVMNAPQHQNPETREILPDDLLAAIEPIELQGPVAVAPGVVLVPAPGHTPGSQLVYVRLADERELLLIGDVAWHMDALRELHYRPRLVTDLFLGEDRAAVMAQFRTLHGLLDDASLQIVVSHDADQRHELVKSGALGDGLELSRPQS